MNDLKHLSDIDHDKLVLLKREIKKYSEYPNIAPVSVKMIRYFTVHSIDGYIAKEGRNRFYSWLFDRTIETSKINDEVSPELAEAMVAMGHEVIINGLNNSEAFALLMWGKPAKVGNEWTLSKGYTVMLPSIVAAFGVQNADA